MPGHDAFDVGITGGRSLRVHRWPGRGAGACAASSAPLILLHGLLDDASGWSAFAERTHRPVLAIDLPGFGGSSLPERPRISAYGEDIALALARLAVAGATLVGHSLGGAVATAVAVRSPAVDALVLLAPAGFGPIRLAEFFALPGVVDLAEAALPLGLANPLVVTAAYAAVIGHGHLPAPELVERLRRRAWQSGRGTRLAVEAIAAAGRSRHGFHRGPVPFDGPVAALWGARDALVPVAHAQAVRRAFAHARVDVWEGMGHHPQRERPDELQAYVERAAWAAHARAAAGPGDAPGAAVA